MKHFGRAGAVALTGTALAAAATMTAALPAQAAPRLAQTAAAPGWRIDKTVATRGKPFTLLFSVAAVSRSDAWAAGISAPKSGSKLTPVFRHWTGRRWLSAKVPAALARKFNKDGAPFSRVAASSAGNVWDFGELGGAYLRLDGRRWSLGKLPGSASGTLVEVDDALAFSRSDVWALGMKISSRTDKATPYAAWFNGTGWTRKTVPGSGSVISASAVSAGDIWAVVSGFEDPNGSSAGSSVVQWNGASWQAAATQPTLPAKAELAAIVAQSDTDVWIGGSAPNAKKGTSELAEQWNGASWTGNSPSPVPTRAKYLLEQLAPDGSGGLWGLATNESGTAERIWRMSGGTWSQVKPQFGHHSWELLQLANVPGTKSTWAVGAIKIGRKADGLIAVAGPLPR